MIRRCGSYRAAAFLFVVYSDDFSTGVAENTRGTCGYCSPLRVQFVFRDGERVLTVTWAQKAVELLDRLGMQQPQQREIRVR